MKQNTFKKLRADLSTLRLKEDDRRAMKMQLQELVGTSLTDECAYRVSFFEAMRLGMQRMAVPVTLAIVVLMSGTGVVFASESSLPGDALYPVKRRVAEPVRALFARTPEKRAELHAKFISRRFDEAEKLLKKKRMNKAYLHEISLDVSERTDEVNSVLQSIGKKDILRAETSVKAVKEDLKHHRQQLLQYKKERAEEKQIKKENDDSDAVDDLLKTVDDTANALIELHVKEEKELPKNILEKKQGGRVIEGSIPNGRLKEQWR